MIDIKEVIETNKMIKEMNLDVRTITLGISLLDCMDNDLNKMKEIIYTKNAPEPIGPYSQAILVNNTLYASGQIAINPDTNEFVDGDIKTQTEQVCKNINEILKAAGMSFENVVKTICFLAYISDFGIFNKVYEEYFVSNPARSCVAAKELPKNALVEIEIIATK